MIGFLLPPVLPKPEAALVDAESASADVRWVAAQALGRVRGPLKGQAVAALRSLFSDPVPEVRAQAVEGMVEQALAEEDGSEPDWLVDALADDEPCVRCAAVDAACTLASSPLERIAPLAKDPDPSVRMVTATALGELGDPLGVPTILSLLEDNELTVLRAAAGAAASLGNASGEAVLLAQAADSSADTEDAYLCLGRIHSVDATTLLRKSAGAIFGPISGKAAAAVALFACTDGAEGRDRIERLLSSRKAEARIAAFSALCRLPVRGISDAVARAADHSDEMVVSSAVETLLTLSQVDSAAGDALRSLRGRVSGDTAAELEEALAMSARESV